MSRISHMISSGSLFLSSYPDFPTYLVMYNDIQKMRRSVIEGFLMRLQLLPAQNDNGKLRDESIRSLVQPQQEYGFRLSTQRRLFSYDVILELKIALNHREKVL
ncbi:hypothetical protein Tco_0489100 [Tanacetum coccineum]